MKAHVSSPAAVLPSSTHDAPLAGLVHFLNDRFLWLPIGTLLAVLWANVDPERYFTLAHRLDFPINEIGMALFLALVVQEAIEALGPGGALHHWRHWATPLVAAAGGVAGAAFTYLAYVTWSGEMVLARAWPVAAAVDIAAGYYVLRLVFPRGAAFPFLLVSGIAADAVGLVVLAIWPAFTPDHIVGALIVLSAVALAAVFRRTGVREPWIYLVYAGAISWCGFKQAGVHPALALVPIVPLLPRSPLLEPFADGPGAPPSARFRDPLVTVVQIVLFLFGLVNGGTMLRGYDTGTWAVLAGALVGRPVGMMAATAVARLAGLRLPASIGYRDLIVIALATTSGFTFALFTAVTLLPVGGALTQIRIGALGTAVGAALAYGAARALRVGRFVTAR